MPGEENMLMYSLMVGISSGAKPEAKRILRWMTMNRLPLTAKRVEMVKIDEIVIDCDNELFYCALLYIL